MKFFLSSLFIIICFVFSTAYYIACDTKDCDANINLQEIQNKIKKQYFSCYITTINNRESKISCYKHFYSFFHTDYYIFKCDMYDYEKIIKKNISNELNLCTNNPIPIYSNKDFDNLNMISIKEISTFVKYYEIINYKEIDKQLEKEALNNNAYAIIKHDKKLIVEPKKKCRRVRFGKVLFRKCQWINVSYWEIKYELLFI